MTSSYISPPVNPNTRQTEVSQTEVLRARPASNPCENHLSQPLKYTYSGLLDQGNIRLLRLMPHRDGKADIQCQLFEYHLGEGTHLYEALSYEWGSEDNPRPISVLSDKSGGDAYHFLVRANLHAALSHLRNHYTERIFWVDAICIDQTNNIEKGEQVQFMAKIFSKARGVIVWLGEATAESDEALEAIREAAEEQHTNTPVDIATHQVAFPSQPAANSTSRAKFSPEVSSLLERPWFQRFWVLQEVAAARHILVKCGDMEIDGYGFCSGLNALQLPYETNPNLQGLMPPMIYLIQGASFRVRGGREESRQSERFSLRIRPLRELVDMYHNRKASLLLDKVYALLGMSTEKTIPDQLLVDYEARWEILFQNLIKFSLFGRISNEDPISVAIRDDHKELAVISHRGYGLGSVSSSKRDGTCGDRQRVEIDWKSSLDAKGRESSSVILLSAKSIEKGDVICLLQGASNPSIIRPRDGYWVIIMIAAPLDGLELAFKSITIFPNDLLLVWDWDPQDGRDYKALVGNQQEPWSEVTRLWNIGLFLNAVERYQETILTIRKAMSVYEEVLRSTDTSTYHGPWREADEEVREVIDVLLAHYALRLHTANMETLYETYGLTPLAWAATRGYDALVRQFVDKGANIEATEGIGWAPLTWAAENGHTVAARYLLEKGAEIDKEDADGRTPLWWAARSGHEAVVQLLLENGASLEMNDPDELSPLLPASENAHEAVVRLLVEAGSSLEEQDALGRTPLFCVAEKGHRALVEYLLKRGADIEATNEGGLTPLFVAVKLGHEAVVQHLLERGANIETDMVDSDTLLWWAEKSGKDVVAELIRNHVGISPKTS